jgi:hypothetical protein
VRAGDEERDAERELEHFACHFVGMLTDGQRDGAERIGEKQHDHLAEHHADREREPVPPSALAAEHRQRAPSATALAPATKA